MKLSELDLKLMAKHAAGDFLSKEIPLTDTVAKLASERGLNAHQVARVCEQANLDTYNALWDKIGSGQFEFPLADQDAVMSILEKQASPSITADEYSAGPNQVAKLIRDFCGKEKKASSDLLEKVAANHSTPMPEVHPKQITKIASYIDHYKKELEAGIFEAEAARSDAQSALTSMLKTAKLTGENVMNAFFAGVVAYPDRTDKVAEILAESFRRLGFKDPDLAKLAQKVTEDATGQASQDYSAVNKNHALLKHINTIMEADDLIASGKDTHKFLVEKSELLCDRAQPKTLDLTKDIKDVEPTAE